MDSEEFLKLAKEVLKRDSTVFDQLVEYEETKKIRTKTRLNFTIDRNVAMKFRKYCREKGYNMSARIEQAMREMIK